MQKIKDELIKKLYRLDVNSKYTLIVMLELLNIADARGVVEIYYKEMTDRIGCATSTFYDVIHALSDMGFIKIRKADYKSDLHIQIPGNDFTKADAYTDYVNTNSVFFSEGLYRNLGAGAIKTYLFFMYRVLKAGAKESNLSSAEESQRTERNKLKYNKNTSYAKIAIQIGLCPLNLKPNRVPNKDIRAVKNYIRELISNKLITVGSALKQDKGTYVTVEKWALVTPTVDLTEKGAIRPTVAKPLFLNWQHLVKTICRRCKQNFDAQNLRDTAILINQYEKKAREQGRDILVILKNAIWEVQKEILDSKAVHAIVRKMIEKDYAYDLLIYQG